MILWKSLVLATWTYLSPLALFIDDDDDEVFSLWFKCLKQCDYQVIHQASMEQKEYVIADVFRTPSCQAQI